MKEKSSIVRRRKYEKCQPNRSVEAVKHPLKIMVWSVIIGKSRGSLYMMGGMMNHAEYRKVLKEKLIP